jgi:hypothetical protein
MSMIVERISDGVKLEVNEASVILRFPLNDSKIQLPVWMIEEAIKEYQKKNVVLNATVTSS